MNVKISQIVKGSHDNIRESNIFTLKYLPNFLKTSIKITKHDQTLPNLNKL